MDRLKELRLSAGKSGDQIAQYLNITNSAYYKYENGKAEPNIENLIKLADFYNVSLDYVCNRSFSNEVGFLTQEQNAFVKAYLKLNEFDQAHVYGVVLGMLAKY